MKKRKTASEKGSAEQISADEALRRMKRFVDRKERFVDAVKKGKDRGLPS
jgi:hypothetical protein